MTSNLYQRGRVNLGNVTRMKKLFKKLQAGEKIVYGAIGGSITQGSAASSPEYRYVERFASWLRTRYSATVDVVNAGIGASNSLFGAFRVEKDLLVHQPDLITIEYAVNDTTNPDTQAAYEALIRKCLTLSPDVAVILIFTMNHSGENKQHLQEPVGLHYQLPMISYRDAVYPEIKQGSWTWEDISPDTVHPNDLGHEMIADMLSRLTEDIAAADEQTESLPLPDYQFPGAAKYENARIIDAASMDLIAQSGWNQGPHKAGYTGWQTDQPGAWLEVRFSGTYLAIGSQQYSGDFGRASVSIDGKEPVVIEGYFTKAENTVWAGGHTIISVINEQLPPGEHTLKLTILPERHTNSNGYKFDIGYLLIAQ